MSKKNVSKSKMRAQTQTAPAAVPVTASPKGLTEDWLAVIIAFVLCIVAAIGLNITF